MREFGGADERGDLEAVIGGQRQGAAGDWVLAERCVLVRPILQLCARGRQLQVHGTRLALLPLNLQLTSEDNVNHV